MEVLRHLGGMSLLSMFQCRVGSQVGGLVLEPSWEIFGAKQGFLAAKLGDLAAKLRGLGATLGGS